MTAISLRLAPLIAVALMLAVAGCSLESGSQGSDQKSGSQDVNQDPGSQNANQRSSSQDANSGNASSEASSEPTTQAFEAAAGTGSSCGESPEEILDLQYRYINAGDYEAAYALFATQSKALIPPDQYRAFFEENAPYSVTDYSFPSVDVRGGAATVGVSFTLGDAEGQERAAVTQELVCEGAWRVVMRAEQVAAFAEAGQETAQYEPPEEQQQPGFERFVGDWRVHGSQMVIRSDFTGMKRSSAGPCITSIDYKGPMCSDIQQLEFSEAPSGGIVATITSVEHETWEGDPPPPGFEPDGTFQVGDSFELEFVDDDLLRTTWLGRLSHLNGQGNPYWCNSQTSDENSRECGA